jgi:hypothetical protein
MTREENFSMAIPNHSHKPRRPLLLPNILHIISGLENKLQHAFTAFHMHLMHIGMDYLNPPLCSSRLACGKLTHTKMWQELLHCLLTSHWLICKRTKVPTWLTRPSFSTTLGMMCDCGIARPLSRSAGCNMSGCKWGGLSWRRCPAQTLIFYRHEMTGKIGT